MEAHFLGRTRISKNWLFSPPVHGLWAVAIAIAGIALPTFIRLSLLPSINDESCTFFCPFVLTVAILCGWRYALATAVGGAIMCNTVLMGSPYRFHFEKRELEVLLTFLFYSVFIISVVWLFRTTAARSLRQAGAEESASGVVFSLDGGQAWASWYGVDAPVRLGRPEEVVPMMEDFIAQVNLAKRYADRTPSKAVNS